jgi:PKD repeat protein
MYCSWGFGDGTGESFVPLAGQYFHFCPTVTHVYTTAGSYTVGLYVQKVTGQPNSFTRHNYIQVSGPPLWRRRFYMPMITR